MGRVISFEDRALASLRARVAAAEEANQDLIAFARGHSGAVASIHAAVLAAIEAEGLDHLIHIVTQEWPQILGLDAVAVALWAGETGVRADASGLQFVNPRLIERSLPLHDRRPESISRYGSRRSDERHEQIDGNGDRRGPEAAKETGRAHAWLIRSGVRPQWSVAHTWPHGSQRSL